MTKRLTFFIDAYNKLAESQAGFREGYRTVDNAFVLYSIIDKYFNSRGKFVYVCFVDFKKAFDSVDRYILYEILQKNGLKGKLYKAITSLYSSIKGCVRAAGELSDVFNCPIGLRQGCNLSPILFAMFINELYEFMVQNNIRGIQLFPSIIEIFLLMFADDIALISDTVKGLQKQLNTLNTFCSRNKLTVNIDKTKIVVFKKGGNLARREKWHYGETELEVVNGYTYVGLYFTNRLSTINMAEAMSTKAKCVLAQILNTFSELHYVPYHTFFKVFDSKISSILLYGSEIWGLKHMSCIEKIHIYACKRYLNAPANSCNDAIMGDLARFPMFINTSKRCIKYWLRILQLPAHRYVRACYEMLKHFDQLGHINWVTHLRIHLFSNGFGYVWQMQGVSNETIFLNQYIQRVKDQYIQTWRLNCEESRKLNYYKIFKMNFSLESYITKIDVNKFRACLARFRSSSHSLMIEKGRHLNIDKHFRTCIYCETQIEDEYHFVIICPLYAEIRSKYIPFYFIQNPNVHKYAELFSNSSTDVVRQLAMFLYYAFKERDNYLTMFE